MFYYSLSGFRYLHVLRGSFCGSLGLNGGIQNIFKKNKSSACFKLPQYSCDYHGFLGVMLCECDSNNL